MEVYIQIMHGRKLHLLTCYLLFQRPDQLLINIIDAYLKWCVTCTDW